MSDMTVIKEGDWLLPREIDTPQGPESGPIIYRVFKRQESATEVVYVSYFVGQLAKVMKDLERHLAELAEEKDASEENLKYMSDVLEKVSDPPHSRT